jgi:hypothetical protein
MAALQGAMEAHAGDGVAVGVETEDEQRDAVALFEVGPSQRALKSPTAKDTFGLVEVNLPEVRSFQGMVAFETDA